MNVEENENLSLTEVPVRLHSAQLDVNNLRSLNVFFQSTLFRAQSQLIEFVPIDSADEIRRNQVKTQVEQIRSNDDETRRKISRQNLSLTEILKKVQKNFHRQSSIDLSEHESRHEKYEKQIDVLRQMFNELNTIIHSEHQDRIGQLYLTLTETSRSVDQAQKRLSFPMKIFPWIISICFSVVQRTVQAEKNLLRKRIRRRLFLLSIISLFLLTIFSLVFLSIRVF